MFDIALGDFGTYMPIRLWPTWLVCRGAALGDGEPRFTQCRAFRALPLTRLAALGVLSHERERWDLRRQRFFYGGDELFEREWFWQKSELPVLGQILLEGVFRIAGDEDDLQVRIAIA